MGDKAKRNQKSQEQRNSWEKNNEDKNRGQVKEKKLTSFAHMDVKNFSVQKLAANEWHVGAEVTGEHEGVQWAKAAFGVKSGWMRQQQEVWSP